MDLKEIFGEELANQLSVSGDATVKQIVAKLTEKKLILDDGKLVPQYRVKELTDKIDAQEKQIKKSEEDLRTIKVEAENVPVLKSKISEIQAMNKAERESFDAAQSKSKKSTALLVALMDSGVTDPTAREVLSKNFDVDKLELDETGKPKGFDALLKPIKENPVFKTMFGTPRMVGQEHQDGRSAEPQTLEMKLAEAEKSGRPLVEIVALKRQITEAQANR